MASSSSGNVLFLILIAVALFAALSYAVSQSVTASGGNPPKEELEQLDQARLQSYEISIKTGATRIKMRGCDEVDYTPPADQDSGGDKSCYVFHPNGGQVIYDGTLSQGPDAFSFTDRMSLKNADTTSNIITMSGISLPLSVSISGDGSPDFRINGGLWVDNGTINNGDTLQLRLRTGATNGTYTATVNVGSVSDEWSVTAMAP